MNQARELGLVQFVVDLGELFVVRADSLYHGFESLGQNPDFILPLQVFDLHQAGNIVKAATGQDIGTRIYNK